MSDMERLKRLYTQMNGVRAADESYLRRLEDELQVSLPDEFKSAARFFDGSGFSVLPLHAVAGSPDINILEETRRLRDSIDLPPKFLVLGEPAESLIVLNCLDGKVLWCDAVDAPRLGREQLAVKPEIWESYGDFLDYLISEEQADRE